MPGWKLCENSWKSHVSGLTLRLSRLAWKYRRQLDSHRLNRNATQIWMEIFNACLRRSMRISKIPKSLQTTELQMCFQIERFGSDKLSSGQRFAKTQMYETNKAVIISASSHTDAWHWQVLCMHWDCHRGIPTWSKHWEHMKIVATVAQATRSSEFLFPVNSSTSPLIYANASCFG